MTCTKCLKPMCERDAATYGSRCEDCYATDHAPKSARMFAAIMTTPEDLKNDNKNDMGRERSFKKP